MFLIQNDETFKDADIEHIVLMQELSGSRMYSFIQCGIDEIHLHLNDAKEIIPVGSISFVTKFLSLKYGIDNMTPIEVPEELRKEQFLKRQYSIVKGSGIPRSGNWFIKDASVLKNPTYMGNIENMNLEIDENHLYVVSEVLDIQAEYRVFVRGDKIMGIQFYDGRPDVMPTETEINKLKQMIGIYSLNKSRPKSYAMDIGIMFKEKNRDLIIIELCPFACLGTYGLTGAFLPDMYRDGFIWYKNVNKA